MKISVKHFIVFFRWALIMISGGIGLSLLFLVSKSESLSSISAFFAQPLIGVFWVAVLCIMLALLGIVRLSRKYHRGGFVYTSIDFPACLSHKNLSCFGAHIHHGKLDKFEGSKEIYAANAMIKLKEAIKRTLSSKYPKVDVSVSWPHSFPEALKPLAKSIEHRKIEAICKAFVYVTFYGLRDEDYLKKTSRNKTSVLRACKLFRCAIYRANSFYSKTYCFKICREEFKNFGLRHHPIP